MRAKASEDFEMFLIRPAPISPQENKSNPTQDYLSPGIKARAVRREGRAGLHEKAVFS